MAKAWGRVLAPVPDVDLPEVYSRAMAVHAGSSQRTFPLPATLLLAAWDGMVARRSTIALCNRPDEPLALPAPEPDEPAPVVCPTCRAIALLGARGVLLAHGVTCPDCGTVTP